jgi:catalase
VSRNDPSKREPSTGRDRPEDVYRLHGLFSARRAAALSAIVGIVACTAAAFALTAGWLTRGRLTQTRVVDQFEAANGVHPGFRRNHSKGVCFTGWFDSDGAGETLSRAQVFRPGRTPVFGRFALAGGQPFISDGPMAVRSMAVNFALRDGEVWRTGMNGIPVFTVRSVKDLYDQLAAVTPDPKTGKPDPAKLRTFMATHPATARAMGIIAAQPFSSGFADTTYNSLDAFIFVNASGRASAVRWSMIPEDPFQPDKPDAAHLRDPNYLFDDLASRVRSAPVRWRLVATVGRPEDPTDDATTPWPAGREHVALGVLTIDGLQDEAHGPCRNVTFDPLILPAGIEGSDDPILSARSAAYAQSFVRRAAEPPTPGAVRFADPIRSASQ